MKTAILAVKVSFVRAAGALAKGRMFDMPALGNLTDYTDVLLHFVSDLFWNDPNFNPTCNVGRLKIQHIELNTYNQRNYFLSQ
jgi:hypothetical protein